MALSFANKNRSPWAALRFVVPTATLLASLLTSGAASAASMQGPISGWQQSGEPSNMSMYIYVPDNVADNAPILVALHYCGGNAGNIFSAASSGGVVSAADTNGFIILLPQTSRNCWDVGTTASLTHDGGSDTKSIVHQVEYVVSQYGGNADRVYAMGQSGGAMAVEGLLAVYPDVFKGGAEFSGVAAGCWAVNNMTDGQWSDACAKGMVTHTAQEWGDMARAMYPDYTGAFRPRMQLWHGTGDTTIYPVNHTEAIKQWQNVLGVATTADATASVTISGHGFTHDEYKDDCGMTVLDVMTEPNGPHNTSVTMTSQYTISFLSLDVPGATDPQAVSTCWTGGGTGSGGASGAGGTGSGVGGTSSGVGGTSSGVGGTSSGVGGTSSGVGGTSSGVGGTSTSSGGTGTGAGGVTGAGGAGTVGSGGAISTDGGTPGTSGSCSVNPRNLVPSSSALALAGLFALLFARRRGKRPVRVS